MFTTNGPVCGTCGHKHKSLETAVKCMMKHSGGCRRQGGYSDRAICRVDASGDTSRISEDEYNEAERIEHMLSN